MTCDSYACKKYMDIITSANVENKDGGLFDIQEIGHAYYKTLQLFNVTLDKTMMRNASDTIRNTISKIHADIMDEPYKIARVFEQSRNSRKRYRTDGDGDGDVDIELDDDPVVLCPNTTDYIKRNVTMALRDMTDEAFHTMVDQERLAQFFFETCGFGEDFASVWESRNDYV